MSEFRVASRYARSIFDLSIELKIVDRIFDDMRIVEQVCADNRKLVVLLKNPIVRYDYKLRVLNRIFERHLDTLTIKFFNLICRKNRAGILPDVTKTFVSLYLDYKGIVKAELAAAIELSSSIKKEFERIVAKATGKEVELDTIVDESLIGGYILKIGDNQIDDSLKSKLKSLRRELKGRRY